MFIKKNKKQTEVKLLQYFLFQILFHVLNKPFIVKYRMIEKTFSNLEALAVKYIGKKEGGMCHFSSFSQSETFQKGICNACHIFRIHLIGLTSLEDHEKTDVIAFRQH